MEKIKKAAVLFSGGKDSCMAIYLAKQKDYDVKCLISVYSKNPDSYMFHTPSIKRTEQQAKAMGMPLLIQKTKGEKEEELKDLEKAIKKAKTKYKIDTIVTGAIKSEYQESRIKKICEKNKLECFNPLWQKDELECLNDLINNEFKVIITGVAAHPFDKTWLGRPIDREFIVNIVDIMNKYKINPAGEGGEYETFVLYCPLFKNSLTIKSQKISGEKNAWRMDIEVE